MSKSWKLTIKVFSSVGQFIYQYPLECIAMYRDAVFRFRLSYQNDFRYFSGRVLRCEIDATWGIIFHWFRPLWTRANRKASWRARYYHQCCLLLSLLLSSSFRWHLKICANKISLDLLYFGDRHLLKHTRKREHWRYHSITEAVCSICYQIHTQHPFITAHFRRLYNLLLLHFYLFKQTTVFFKDLSFCFVFLL